MNLPAISFTSIQRKTLSKLFMDLAKAFLLLGFTNPITNSLPMIELLTRSLLNAILGIAMAYTSLLLVEGIKNGS